MIFMQPYGLRAYIWHEVNGNEIIFDISELPKKNMYEETADTYIQDLVKHLWWILLRK